MTHIGRNQSCPCGSGRKFKQCHALAGTSVSIDQLDSSGPLFASPSTLTPIVPAISSEHTVIVMAGGEGSRWRTEGETDVLSANIDVTIEQNKLFVPILGRPLLHRTVDQLHTAGITTPFIYNISDELPNGTTRFVPPVHYEDITDAIAQSASLWIKPVTILLGDVVWSQNALHRVFESHPVPWRFFGKRGRNIHTSKPWGEIYALRFCSSYASQVQRAICALNNQPIWRKKLWELYRMLLGHEVPQSFPSHQYFSSPPASRHFCELLDWTDDIDELSDYTNMMSFFQRKPQMTLQ